MVLALIGFDKNRQRFKILLLPLRHPGQRGDAIQHLNRIIVVDLVAPMTIKKQDRDRRDDGGTLPRFKTAYEFDLPQTGGEPRPEFARVGGQGEERGRGCSKGRRAGPRRDCLRPPRRAQGTGRCPLSQPTEHPRSAPGKNRAILAPDTRPAAAARAAPSDLPHPSRQHGSAFRLQSVLETNSDFARRAWLLRPGPAGLHPVWGSGYGYSWGGRHTRRPMG